jgi:hypothetical protein
MSASFKALSAPLSAGKKPSTWAGEAMCDKSAATCRSVSIHIVPRRYGRTYTGSVDDIVERELGDQGVKLEQEG